MWASRGDLLCGLNILVAGKCLFNGDRNTHTLNMLVNETQWANPVELYVGLVKEATRKDAREAHPPLAL